MRTECNFPDAEPYAIESLGNYHGEEADAAYEEYCCRPFTASCRECGNSVTASQQQLEKLGWLLTHSGGNVIEICGDARHDVLRSLARADRLIEEFEKNGCPFYDGSPLS